MSRKTSKNKRQILLWKRLSPKTLNAIKAESDFNFIILIYFFLITFVLNVLCELSKSYLNSNFLMKSYLDGEELSFILDEGMFVMDKVFPGVTDPIAYVGKFEKK